MSYTNTGTLTHYFFFLILLFRDLTFPSLFPVKNVHTLLKLCPNLPVASANLPVDSAATKGKVTVGFTHPLKTFNTYPIPVASTKPAVAFVPAVVAFTKSIAD